MSRSGRPLDPPSTNAGAGPSRRHGAGSASGAEAAWIARAAERKSQVTLRLRDGATLAGVLDWHDGAALRLDMAEGGHRIVPRSAIAWLERTEDSGRP